MKKIFLFIGLLAFTLPHEAGSQIGIGMGGPGFGMGMRFPLHSNNNREQGPNVDRQVNKMKKDLNLSPDQATDVRMLLVERQRRHDGKNPMKPKEFNERLQNILTPEQMNTLKVQYQQRKQAKEKPADNTTPPSNPNEDPDDVYN